MHPRPSLLVLLLALALVACAGRSPTVAEVDGASISAHDLAAAMTLGQEQYDAILLKNPKEAEAYRRMTLDGLIQEAILVGEASRQGIAITPSEVEQHLKDQGTDLAEARKALTERGVRMDDWLRRQRNRLVVERLTQRKAVELVPVSEGEISNYYTLHRRHFYQPAQFHARQILLDNKEDADEAMAQLKKGDDFASLAKKHSKSPDGKRGGDLGWFDSSTMPPVFGEVCQELKPGETSKVVNTDYGYQIFQLMDRRPPYQRTLQEVHDDIEASLRE